MLNNKNKKKTMKKKALKNLKEGQTLQLTMNSGKGIKGVITDIQLDYFLLKEKYNTIALGINEVKSFKVI